jgi:phospholipid/cholesterol/gamma-HCH transport system substrate-binding protein
MEKGGTVKIKFSLFERVAGLFVLGAAVMALAVTIGMGIKKGWFEQKVPLTTYVKSADGINPGTPVRFLGTRIGSVDHVELRSSSEVVIHFRVLKRFASRINTNSIVHVVRPFVIGEKALEIKDGKFPGQPITNDQVLVAEHSPDFLEMLGGSKLGAYMESLSTTAQNLQKLAEAFLSNERSDQIIQLFDDLTPLMKQMNQMASEVSILSASLNEKKKMARVLDDVLVMAHQLNKALPAVSKDMPKLSKNMIELTQNLNQLSSDMKEIVPVVKKVAPEIPDATQKAVRALDEVVLTLKAMQKTWFLRGNVEEVQEEQMKLKMREPASQ